MSCANCTCANCTCETRKFERVEAELKKRLDEKFMASLNDERRVKYVESVDRMLAVLIRKLDPSINITRDDETGFANMLTLSVEPVRDGERLITYVHI